MNRKHLGRLNFTWFKPAEEQGWHSKATVSSKSWLIHSYMLFLSKLFYLPIKTLESDVEVKTC